MAEKICLSISGIAFRSEGRERKEIDRQLLCMCVVAGKES